MTKTEEIIAAAKAIVEDNSFSSRIGNIPGQYDSYSINGRKLWRLKKALDKDSSDCDCKGWGCWNCCTSEAEIREKQGIFS